MQISGGGRFLVALFDDWGMLEIFLRDSRVMGYSEVGEAWLIALRTEGTYSTFDVGLTTCWVPIGDWFLKS